MMKLYNSPKVDLLRYTMYYVVVPQPCFILSINNRIIVTKSRTHVFIIIQMISNQNTITSQLHIIATITVREYKH